MRRTCARAASLGSTAAVIATERLAEIISMLIQLEPGYMCTAACTRIVRRCCRDRVSQPVRTRVERFQFRDDDDAVRRVHTPRRAFKDFV